MGIKYCFLKLQVVYVGTQPVPVYQYQCICSSVSRFVRTFLTLGGLKRVGRRRETNLTYVVTFKIVL